MAIAGHRTTYGRPFNHVDLLEPGDLIILEVPIGSCTYRVIGRAVHRARPRTSAVVANTPGQAQLTLTTCHPKGSARQRLIVHAELVSGGVSGLRVVRVVRRRAGGAGRRRLVSRLAPLAWRTGGRAEGGWSGGITWP